MYHRQKLLELIYSSVVNMETIRHPNRRLSSAAIHSEDFTLV
jgi:hypothetical protein